MIENMLNNYWGKEMDLLSKVIIIGNFYSYRIVTNIQLIFTDLFGGLR